MKQKSLYITSIIAIIFVLTACSSPNEEIVTRAEISDFQYQIYTDFSNRPTTSILSIALGGNKGESSYDTLLVFTDSDLDFLKSLNAEEVLMLQDRILKAWGFQSIDDLDAQLDYYYEYICGDMSTSQLKQFNTFLTEYIEMTPGIESLKCFDNFCTGHKDVVYDKTYAIAAVAIDTYARPIYELYSKTRSDAYCRKIYATRLAIASIGMVYGYLLPGPGWIVGATCLCDALGASADYINCRKTR